MQARKKGNALGVDVSHWNYNIDWEQAKNSGISFAFLKATEGHSIIDDYLGRNYTGCKENGLGIGLYHFMRATTTDEAIKEADYFIDVLDGLGGISAIDIPPVLDIEDDIGLPRGLVTSIAKTWLERVEKYYGVTPIIYSYPYFINTYFDNSLNRYPLWLASYGTNKPDDMGGWTEWEFIQYSDRGTVNGIGTGVDLNEYKGSVEELMNRLKVEDANKLIAILQGLHTAGFDQEQAHYLANEVRKAAGLPTT